MEWLVICILKLYFGRWIGFPFHAKSIIIAHYSVEDFTCRVAKRLNSLFLYRNIERKSKIIRCAIFSSLVSSLVNYCVKYSDSKLSILFGSPGLLQKNPPRLKGWSRKLTSICLSKVHENSICGKSRPLHSWKCQIGSAFGLGAFWRK